MTTYPPLPLFEGRRGDEPVVAFGARALAFLLEHDGLTATLEDDALEQAEHAAIYVVASRDITVIALEKINAIRLAIAATIARRMKDRARAALPSAVSRQEPPLGGRTARLTPPVPRKPMPTAVVNPF